MKPHARTYAHTHGQTDGQTQMDQLWYEINVPFFLQEKAGENVHFANTSLIFKRSVGRKTLFFIKILHGIK